MNIDGNTAVTKMRQVNFLRHSIIIIVLKLRYTKQITKKEIKGPVMSAPQQQTNMVCKKKK
jgi:hypothetical protein